MDIEKQIVWIERYGAAIAVTGLSLALGSFAYWSVTTHDVTAVVATVLWAPLIIYVVFLIVTGRW